jgi:sulfotransferase family protein
LCTSHGPSSRKRDTSLLPVFRFDRAHGIARAVKGFFSVGDDHTREAVPRDDRYEDKEATYAPRPRVPEPGEKRKGEVKAKKKRLRDEKRELTRLREEFRAARERTQRSGQQKLSESRKTLKNKKQQIFRLRNELKATREGRAGDAPGGPEAGLLPDFVIIGAQKCGTTSLYRLLIRHPYVEPAAAKELHFFDNQFDQGIEWYRRCFPPPRWRDGRKTITGEATPGYIFRPHVPARVAEVVPEARLIVLLRNPVDRAYSHYHHQVKMGNEPLRFEDAIEAEEARLRAERDKILEDEHYIGSDLRHSSYLSRGIYVDQLLRWSRLFSDEQMLVLKSEDFLERPWETLKVVLGFLDLPDWEPPAPETRNEGRYEGMDSDTRRWLEGYFEPHNRRLYEYLGVDFGW